MSSGHSPRKEEVTHEDMLRYYQEHLADFEFPARVRWEQLLVRKEQFRSKAEAYCRAHHLRDRVFFLGNVANLEEVLAACDLFVLPSETESFGMAALEAMASEAPVIATRAGGLPEVVTDGETGFLLPVGDDKRLLDWSEFNRIPWDVLILFGGGFALVLRFALKPVLDTWLQVKKTATAEAERSQQDRRLALVEAELQSLHKSVQMLIDDGSILIDTTGEAVGQINALSIYDLGDTVFGRPSRITCITSAGRGTIVNAAAAPVVVTLVVLEGALRSYNAIWPTYVFYSDSSDRFRGKPGDRHYDEVFNSKGFNDVEHSVRRPPDVAYRIVALGDSFAVGVVPQRDNFLSRLGALLSARATVEVVNMGVSGTQPRDYLSILATEGLAYRPDLVLVDLSMPGMGGIEVASRLKAQPDPPRVAIVTMHDSPSHRAAAAAAGADGFVSKLAFNAEVFPLIRRLFPAAGHP